MAKDRIFEKPLCYAADRDEVFRDIPLFDTDILQYLLEVFWHTDGKSAAVKHIYYKEMEISGRAGRPQQKL